MTQTLVDDDLPRREDPAPLTRGREPKWGPKLEKIMQYPGEWFLIHEGPESRTEAIRKAAKRLPGDFEVVQRKAGDLIKTHARHIGDHHGNGSAHQ